MYSISQYSWISCTFFPGWTKLRTEWHAISPNQLGRLEHYLLLRNKPHTFFRNSSLETHVNIQNQLHLGGHTNDFLRSCSHWTFERLMLQIGLWWLDAMTKDLQFTDSSWVLLIEWWFERCISLRQDTALKYIFRVWRYIRASVCGSKFYMKSETKIKRRNEMPLVHCH